MPTPRVGAQASATRTGTEGWCLVKDGDGRVNVWASPWYSLECGVKSGHETLARTISKHWLVTVLGSSDKGSPQCRRGRTTRETGHSSTSS